MVHAVEIYVDGKLVASKNRELFEEYLQKRARDAKATAWFLRMLKAIFDPASAGSATSFSFTDTGGASRTQNVKVSMGSAVASLFNTYACSQGAYISFGTDPTPPSPTDYKLLNKIAEGSAGVTIDETAGFLLLVGTFTATSNVTIYEIGLEYAGTLASVTTCGRFLLDRTVFSTGIAVSAGQTITVVYRFAL